ncbi:glycosyltransferase family 2 protein [Desulfohalobium retbaense]|uniref:Glycosyl transferase family 2 n=1 Tax=Desulfohalobium retbaense (strain ATCC 49708 / DSM 5692 / JCM 16813 / HR100) TaxID=485915 RepID=C8X4F5_DESRD|nr:glycosyltransferase family 2 protein [Desulfohalobium retbaense]ACV69429.1 glycosyl transferase family 2 [Desulfohalobium retbaense DSM 5692]
MCARDLVSLVIPVFNERENLDHLFGEIQAVCTAMPYDWEVLFVDDGSEDGSLEVIKRLHQAHCEVRYVSFAANCGQSAAFMAGFQRARGTTVITLDADLQNDPQDIPHLLQTLDSHGLDMVIGWRAERQDSWIKLVASRIANRIRNALSRETVRDTGCSLKVMRTHLAKRLPLFDGMHRFMPTLLKLEGARVGEIQVNHRPRRFGFSKYGIWDRAWRGLRDLLAVRWMQDRHVRYAVKDESEKDHALDE